MEVEDSSSSNLINKSISSLQLLQNQRLHMLSVVRIDCYNRIMKVI